MPLRTKSGGAWQTFTDGTLRFKVDGVAQTPQYCRIKANGVWNDSGYRGPPSVPSNMWVQQWNNDPGQTLTGFSGPPGGGPAIDYYHIERYDANGSAVEGYYDTSGSRWWTTPKDTRHQFRVRSHGVNGLWSAWTPYLRVGIGHPSTPNYGYVQRTRDWSNGGSIGNDGTLNNLAGFGVPSSVVCNRIDYNLWLAGWNIDGLTQLSVYPPAFVNSGDRHIDINYNESTLWYRPNWPNPYVGTDYPSFWGNGGRTGIVCREINDGPGTQGGGWYFRSVQGYISLYGVEYYNNYEIVSYNPEQGNYYW
jgi:hypothetical protein